MSLPLDDFMLLSVINTKLRDKYRTLEELCEEEDADIKEIISRLSALGYAYDKDSNSFK